MRLTQIQVRMRELSGVKGNLVRAANALLDNAVKYTPEGGEVVVAVRERDGAVELEVADNGAGIPEDQLPLIFERFHRADPSRTEGGAGLGLSIARQIAEAHGGAIKAESALERAWPDGVKWERCD